MAVIVISGTLAMGLLIGWMVLGYIMAVHTVHAASDLAALTAASHAAQGASDDEACAMAERVAGDNGAHADSCEIVRAGTEVAAEVEVSASLRWSMPGLPRQVSSTSFAGNPASVQSAG
ncbi:MAG: hypothetical protein FWD75_01080 [Propionibacteriaceae bacterium]|nr:hypothetical protein [Propionibacteriaceae bacterium]